VYVGLKLLVYVGLKLLSSLWAGGAGGRAARRHPRVGCVLAAASLAHILLGLRERVPAAVLRLLALLVQKYEY
jgi:hypothetical protein